MDGLLRFLREMYNLAEWVSEENTVDDSKDSKAKVESLKNASQKTSSNSGVSAWTTKAKPGSGMGLPPPQGQKHKGGGNDPVEQIEAAGYEVELRAFEDGSGTTWELVDPVRNSLAPLRIISQFPAATVSSGVDRV